MPRISFDIKEIKRICDIAKKHKKKTYLVKDQGIYIMCEAIEKTPTKDGLVVYAKGFDPTINKDWWDESYKISRDDFYEVLPIKDWLSYLLKIKPQARVFAINISLSSISLSQ